MFTKLSKLNSAGREPEHGLRRRARGAGRKYGERAQPQARSIKVTFPTDGEEDFHVDVVPAVRKG